MLPANMNRNGLHRRPSFFGQGLLILLPVLFLAVVGIVSLWQDRASSERDAREQARRLAAQMAGNLSIPIEQFLRVDPELAGLQGNHEWTRMDTNGRSGFSQPLNEPVYRAAHSPARSELCFLDESGRLSYPPPADESPRPSPILLELSQDARSAWEKTRELLSAGDTNAATDTFEAVKSSIQNMPAADPQAERSFRVLFDYYAAVGSGDPQRLQDAAQRAESFGVTTESGLPLELPARFQAAQLRLKMSPPADLARALAELAETAVFHPSVLSEPALRQACEWAAQARLAPGDLAVVQDWAKVWQAHETARLIYQAWRDHPRQAPLIDGEYWLVASTNSRNGGMLLARPLGSLADHIRQLLKDNPPPEFLGVTITIAGQPLVQSSGATARNVVLTTEPTFSSDLAAGADCRITFFLRDTASLMASQRRRAWMFGTVIVLAAGVAGAGFVGARRAFHRQWELSEMKSNFVSSVSHELRAPIASVRLLAESLEQGRIPGQEKQHDYYHLIVQECRRLTIFIENVLDFSRIEQGRKKFEFEPADLSALARQTVQLMEPQALERSIKLLLALEATPNGPLELVCDGLSLQQALVNLIDNALKHAPEGTEISIGLQESDGICRLWVEDHGSGIPAEDHERIFEPFYRRGSELRRETQGVGIGLTIVKHTVEAHGGRVVVRSAVGQGSRFTMELPVKREVVERM